MATSKPRFDRRIVRSRNAILSAFEHLLMEKPLADITVSAIAREANVDRKTFYVHFGTVDGLLDAIAVDVVEMIVDSVEKTLASMDGDTNERALGAAATFKVTEITADDFRDAAHLHIEGYMMFNMDVFLHVLKLAKDHGATVSLDLASFEIVRTFRDRLDDILRRYVDVVFANEDEAREFLGHPGSFDPQEAAAALQEYCDVAAVKLGKQGACLRAGRETVFVKSELVTAVDTTGAGDLWQSGFLYAWLNGCSLETAGEMGAILGAEVVQVIGASIPPYRWEPVKARFQKLIYRS